MEDLRFGITFPAKTPKICSCFYQKYKETDLFTKMRFQTFFCSNTCSLCTLAKLENTLVLFPFSSVKTFYKRKVSSPLKKIKKDIPFGFCLEFARGRQRQDGTFRGQGR